MPRALVTGASAGIGAAFARRLAADGFDVVLVARDVERLHAIAAELPGTAEVLPADLTDPGALAAVERHLGAGPPVDLLVANAGAGTYGAFLDLPVDGEAAIVALNVVAPLRLAHAAGRAMRARRAGGIVLVSSMSAFQALPGNATYAASKAFLASFGQALHEELRRDGVTVTTVCPGYTRTEFHERAGLRLGATPRPVWTSAEAVVSATLRAHRAGRAVCVPGVANRLAATASRMAPLVLSRRIGGIVNRRTTGTA
jgi:short-subunit dehydrogenase